MRLCFSTLKKNCVYHFTQKYLHLIGTWSLSYDVPSLCRHCCEVASWFVDSLESLLIFGWAKGTGSSLFPLVAAMLARPLFSSFCTFFWNFPPLEVSNQFKTLLNEMSHATAMTTLMFWFIFINRELVSTSVYLVRSITTCSHSNWVLHSLLSLLIIMP